MEVSVTGTRVRYEIDIPNPHRFATILWAAAPHSLPRGYALKDAHLPTLFTAATSFGVIEQYLETAP
jgi:hypothetical protein